MADQREEILNFIKYKGPVLPVQIAKHVNTNILFASAMLSELVSRKILKISHASIGGSPLYYLPGQESSMDERLCKSLGGREKQVYELLKSSKILREKDLEPWQRIAVKSINDFSVPINVKAGEDTEVFWKYHLVSDEEAKPIISHTLEEVYSEQIQLTNSAVQETVVTPNGLSQEIPTEQTFVKQPKASVQQPLVAEVQNIEEVKIVKIKKEPKKVDTNFYVKVLDFIKDNKVEILKEEVVKKDKEIDFVVNLATNFGKLRYLIKAKNKPAINEADISIAFSEGQLKKMPVILLTNGKANKKASLLVDQKMQGQLIIREL